MLYIPDTTWSGNGKDNDISTNYTVDSSAIYCFAQATTPFQYCEDLQSLRLEILHYWEGVMNKAEVGSAEYNNATSMMKNYSNLEMTLAPTLSKKGTTIKKNPVWEYYCEYSLIPGYFQHSGFHIGWVSNGGTTDEYPLEKGTITGGLYTAPFTAVNKSTGKEQPIGIDCGGLVRMSISYRGSTYIGGLKYGQNLWFDTKERTEPLPQGENNDMHEEPVTNFV